MNQLLSLLPTGDHPETMFMLLFLDRMPPNISAQLTACTFRHLRDMAAYAGISSGGSIVGSTASCLTSIYSLPAVFLSLQPQSQPVAGTPLLF